MKQEKAVREAVSQAVKAQVLEGVLAQSGLSMTAQDYGKAVEAGQVTREQAQKINAAVEQMMGSDDVKAKLEAAVAEQIDALVGRIWLTEFVQKQLEEAIAPAKAGYESTEFSQDAAGFKSMPFVTRSRTAIRTASARRQRGSCAA